MHSDALIYSDREFSLFPRETLSKEELSTGAHKKTTKSITYLLRTAPVL